MKPVLNEEDREALIEYRIERSEQSIREADHNAKGGFYNNAVNRLYYSAYYAVSALLIQSEIYPSSHVGVKSMLGLHFVRTGKISIELGRIFTTLYDNRQSSDYEDFIYCDEVLYDSLRPKTILFIEAIKQLIHGQEESK